MTRITLNVDGSSHSLDVDPQMPLLYALRDNLGMNNPHFGCGLAQCGACTVLMDGVPVRSCALPAAAARGKLQTLRGIGTAEHPHPVQQAFIDEQVSFCGYCASGWILSAVQLLDSTPNPDDEQIRQHFSGLKCRCGTHTAVARAVRRAAAAMQKR